MTEASLNSELDLKNKQNFCETAKREMEPQTGEHQYMQSRGGKHVWEIKKGEKVC
jgi:hypothetical protein